MNTDVSISRSLSQNHRVIQVGRDIRTSLIQPPAQSRAALGSDKVAQGFIRFSVESFEGRMLHNLSRSLLQCLISLLWRSFSLYPVWIPLVSTYICFLSFSCCATLRGSGLHLLEHLPMGGRLIFCCWVFPKPFLFQAEQAHFPKPFLMEHCSNPSHPGAISWTRSTLLMSFLYWGPKPDAVSRCGFASAE